LLVVVEKFAGDFRFVFLPLLVTINIKCSASRKLKAAPRDQGKAKTFSASSVSFTENKAKLLQIIMKLLGR